MYSVSLISLVNDTLKKDFVEWAGDYQHYIDMKKELEEKLKITA